MAVQIDVTYTGALQCAAIHEPSGDTLHTDAPKDNQGQGGHFSPTDLLATALGSCMLTTMAIAARARNLDLQGASAVVHKEMGATPRRHVQKLTVRVKLAATVPPVERPILEKIAAQCPVAVSLAASTEVDLAFEYT